jgi:hypothetical protein
MTMPLAENPAVLRPRSTLTPKQQDALTAISFYRRQLAVDGYWRIGNKTFAPSTIAALQRLSLIRVRSGSSSFDRISLTQAGKLAHERLKGGE